MSKQHGIKGNWKWKGMVSGVFCLTAAGMLFTGCGKDSEQPVETASQQTEVSSSAQPAGQADGQEGTQVEVDLDALFQANEPDVVMARHTSVRMDEDIHLSDAETGTYVQFISKDLVANEGIGQKVLYVDGVGLMISEDDQNGMMATIYTDPANYEDMISSDNFLGLGNEGETVTQSYAQDGSLFVTTEITDPLILRKNLEGLGREYQEGEEVVLHYVFDEQTKDVLSIEIVEQNGSSQESLAKTDYSYDVEYDKAGSPFADYFNAEKKRKMTITYAPGTGLEESITAELPKGIMFNVWCDGDWAQGFYTDPECTKLYETPAADDYSDLSLYVPSRYHEITDAEKAKVQELVAANSAEQMLSRNQSVTIETNTYHHNHVANYDTMYLDADTYMENDSEGFALLAKKDIYLAVEQSDDDDVLVENYMESEDAYLDVMHEMQKNASLHLAEAETLSWYYADDDYIFVKTISQDGAALKESMEGQIANYGEDNYVYEDGMTAQWLYIFDAKTSDILENDSFIVEKNGKKHPFIFSTVRYDEAPLDVDDSPLASYFAQSSTRKVIATFAPGMAEEVVKEFELPDGVYFWVIYKGMPVEAVYSDETCTQPFTRPETGDMYIYISADGK